MKNRFWRKNPFFGIQIYYYLYILRQQCDTVPERVCVPNTQEVCRNENIQKCTPGYRQQCRDVWREEKQPYTDQECWNEPQRICKHVWVEDGYNNKIWKKRCINQNQVSTLGL
jgi:hypothetical protein